MWCETLQYAQMKVVVETQEEYDAWLLKQNTLSEKLLTQK